LNFVVDTWVLYKAHEQNREAILVLANIYKKCHKVFVDNEGEILTEYRSIKGDTFITKWLTLVVARRVIKIMIKKRCKNILNHRKDMKFVYVCLNCRVVKSIVSEDYHFVKNSAKLLKKRITLLSLNDALELAKRQG
jgi:hypothetical protein